MDKLFYRVNITLGFILILFTAIILVSDNAHSQSAQTNSEVYEKLGITRLDDNITILNKELKVSFNQSDFKVPFKSDGNNGKATGERKSQFSDNAGAAKLSPIDIPLNIKINPDRTKLITPGIPQYKVVKSPTALLDTTCVSGGDKSNQNCIDKAISARVYAEALSTKTLTDANKLAGPTTAETQPDEIGFFTRLKNLFITGPNLNTPDQSRTASGSMSFWGDDDLDQILLPVDNVIKTESAGVYKDVDYELQHLSPIQEINIQDKVCDNLHRSITSSNQSNPNQPISSICDAFSPTVKKEDNTSIITSIINFFTTSTNDNLTNQQKISVPIPTRKIAKAGSMNVAYNFCQAKGNKWGTEFKNPYDPMDSTITVAVKQPDGTIQNEKRPDPNGNYYKYIALSSATKQCIAAVEAYHSDDNGYGRAKNCADMAVSSNGSSSCDEFTVEESNLNYSQTNEDIPISMEAHLQNAVFNYMDPNPGYPQKNYLAPDYCAKLDIGYDISDASSGNYIYKVGGGENGNQTSFTNQYCVIGAILSNPAKVMLDQQTSLSTAPNSAGYINESKTALTCDKKEVGIFGANTIITDNLTPNSKLVYQVADDRGFHTGGHGNLNSNDTMFYHGSDFYKLDEVLDEIHRMDLENPTTPLSDKPDKNNVSFFRYGNDDIRILSGNNDKPKYIVGVTQKTIEAKDNSLKRNVVLCKIDSDLQRSNLTKQTATTTEKPRLCFVINSSDKLFLTGKPVLSKVSINGVDRDVVTLVRYSYTYNGDKLPLVYDQILVDETNIEKSEIIKSNVVLHPDNPGGYEVKLLKDEEIAIVTPKPRKFIIIDPRISKSENQIVKVIENLCDGDTNSINCKYLERSAVTTKLIENPINNSVYVAMVGGNVGMIFNVTNTSHPTGSLFAFNKQGVSVPDEESRKNEENTTKEELDKIEKDYGVEVKNAVEASFDYKSEENSKLTNAFIDPASNEFVLFISSKTRSYMLRLSSPTSIFQNPDSSLDFVNQVSGGSGSLVTLEKEFNPANFLWDCSNYDGVKPGQCGYDSLSPIGRPSIIDTEIMPNGQIKAWYTYTGIKSNAIFYSPDIEYSYRGVYEKVGEKYSNHYVAGIATDKSPNVVKVLPDYGFIDQYTVRADQERANCMKILNTKVTDEDKFYNIPGIQKVNLAKNIIKTQKDKNMQSQDPGGYCEETQCIPDSFDIAGNSKFDTTNTANNAAVRAALKEHFKATGRGDAARLSGIDTVCAAAESKGIHCGILVAIWIKETGADPREEHVQNFGCFDNVSYGLAAQAQCAANTVYNKIKVEYKEGIVLEGSSAINTPNINCQPVKGSCIAGTKYSYLFQKYTPADSRIDIENQCNTGVVVRPDQQADGIKCNTAGPTAMTEVCNPRAGTSSRKWPTGKATETNPNLFATLNAINEQLDKSNHSDLKIATSNECYPGGGSSTSASGNVPVTYKTTENIKKNYDITSDFKTFKMNVGAWGKTYGAANVRMALDYNIGTGTPGGILGTHMINPGGKFDYNDILGNPNDSDVDKLKPLLIAKGYNFNGEKIVGGGWCELATTIRVAASRTTVLGSGLSGTPRFNVSVSSGGLYGTGKGYTGDIENAQHSLGNGSPIPLSYFNNSLSVAGDDLTDPLMYVSIYSKPSDTSNDGDLVIYNKSTNNETLFINVYEEREGIISVDVFFAKPKTTQASVNNDNLGFKNDINIPFYNFDIRKIYI